MKHRLDDAMADQIIAAMRAGAGYQRACAAVGVSRSVSRRWRRLGEQHEMEGEETPFSRLADGVRKAHAERVTEAENCIRLKILDGNEKSAMWLLERLAPDDYGPTAERHRGEIKEDAATWVLETLRKGLEPDEYKRVLGVLVSARGDGGTATAGLGAALDS